MCAFVTGQFRICFSSMYLMNSLVLGDPIIPIMSWRERASTVSEYSLKGWLVCSYLLCKLRHTQHCFENQGRIAPSWKAEIPWQWCPRWVTQILGLVYYCTSACVSSAHYSRTKHLLFYRDETTALQVSILSSKCPYPQYRTGPD